LLRLLAGVVVGLVGIFGLVMGAMALSKLPGQDKDLGFKPATEHERAMREELEQHVRVLAGDIGPRNLNFAPENLARARDYIEGELAARGLAVTRQTVTVEDRSGDNLLASIAGSDPKAPVIVLAAHYDSYNTAPGANDNASGVAALLALARVLKDTAPSRSILLAALVNEEPPYFKSEFMGSEHFAEALKQEKREVELMLSLETLGYYSPKPKSQAYPFPVGLLFPDTGGFVGLVSNVASRPKLVRFGGLMQQKARVGANGIALPAFIEGVDWSDHLSFWKRGYDALMVTDTAVFRYPYYHTLEDTADKLDYDSLTGVVLAVEESVRELAR